MQVSEDVATLHTCHSSKMAFVSPGLDLCRPSVRGYSKVGLPSLVLSILATMSKDKSFYIAGQPTDTPLPISRPIRPSTADTTATTVSDPFATPVSSRPPSIRRLQPPSSPSPSRVSFPDSLSTGLRNRPSLIGNQPYSFSSARSSFRISSTLTPNAALPSQTPATEIPAPKPKAPRMRSHMLSDSNPIPKPWKNIKSIRAVVSYWIVYFIIFLGIAGGAFQCYWTYINVPLDKQPLCIVLDENFDNEDAVFGPGGTFFREVNMDGFG